MIQGLERLAPEIYEILILFFQTITICLLIFQIQGDQNQNLLIQMAITP